ncbi:MAG: hypothetical protein JWL98_2246, partial [Xanthomonadaceae bacterium]|nr:hypothetical protein [Xanthomonadaceae bacterium]
GIQASGQSGSTIHNTGTVYASGDSTTTGILAQTVDGNATIDYSSSITVNSGYDAIGLSAVSANGDASASSTGFMQVIGHGGLTSVIQAYSANGNASASNAGFVISGSYGGSAVGVSATSASGDAAATNTADGYLRVVTPGDKNARATGVSAITFNGDASASNDGTVTSISSYGSAVGINANATGGDAAASNTGTINASNVLFGNARGIQAVSSTGNAMVDNSGTIIAVSNQVLGYPFSLTTIDGIGAQSYTGTSITNIGYINAVGPWFVNGIEGFAIYGDVNVTNAESGKIVAIGLSADGIKVVADYGPFQAVVDNAGSIIVTQEGDCHCSGIAPYATGIYALSAFAGGVGVSNSGSISLNTQHGALGIRAYTYNNEATVDNSGSISIATTGYNQVNFGISDKSAYGDASVLNSGDITITTGAIPNVYHPINFVVGIYGHTGRHHTTNGAGYYGAGDTTIVNTGTINLIDAVTGIGIRAVAQYGSALVGNSGVISIDDIASGWGIEAEDDGLPCSTTCTTPSTGASVAVIDNSGSIVVTAPGDARGIVARTNGMSGAAITNSGDIELAAMGYSAFGVFVRNYAFTGTSDLTVDNSGSINASNHAGTNYAGFRGAQANGIRMLSYSNHSIVNNTGSITADTTTSGTAAGSALGVLVKNGYADHYGDTDISNAGSITASIISTNSTTSFHSYYARGAFAGGIVANATYGDVAVHNVGAIAATAKGAYYAGDGVTTADGISVVSSVGNSTVRSLTLGDLTVSNSSAGSITVSAESSYGTGSAVANGIAALVAVGSYGSSLVSSGYGIAVANAGSVSATAFIDAAAQGAATANGISAINGSAAGFSKVANSGDVTATATTTGAATATGVLANASIVDVALYSGGTVSANATGTSGNATGLSITGGTITAVNHGALDATFNG